MQRYTSFYLTGILFFLLTACQAQEETKGTEQAFQPLPIEGLAPLVPEKTDTLVIAGAPNHITRNIIQDQKGNIWFATFEGIIRYDGQTFTNVTKGVSDYRFFSLLEDQAGNFWFGSIGGGVYRYDGISFNRFTVEDGLISNEVMWISEDQNGNIWLGANKGASRYDGQSFQNYALHKQSITAVTAESDLLKELQKQPNRPSYEVNTIIEDQSGQFWLGTRGKTFRYDGQAFTEVTREGKSFYNTRHLLEDNNGHIWLGGTSGLWRYDGNTFINFTRDFVGYIYEDSKGNIWTSSERKSQPGWTLSRYDATSLNTNQPIATPIKTGEGMLFGIVEDKDGLIWAGTLSGVLRYNGSIVTHFMRE